MEDHIQEREIDLLLLAPERLNEDRRKEIEIHLSGCAECRHTMSFLQDFYRELESHGTESDVRVEEFVSQLVQRAPVIKLTPFRFNPDPAEFGDKMPTVLAAQAGPQHEYQFSAVCTLISKDERSLVRILKDNDRRTYRLFLMARDRPADSRATVSFPFIGVTVTVEPGSTHADLGFPPNIHEVDWQTIAAELRFSQD